MADKNTENKAQEKAPVKKLRLEEVLGGSNFQAYQTAAAAIDSYSRLKDSPSFNPHSAGTLFYKALREMSSEISDSAERADLQAKMDAMGLNVRDGTLTKEALNSTADYLRTFMNPYLNKIKGNIESDHHQFMALNILANREKFGNEFNSIAAIPGGARATQIGIVLGMLDDSMKSNDTSKLPSLYKTLTPPNIEQSYMKLGMTNEEAKATVAAGEKCYKELVTSLSENARQEHMMHLHKILQSELYNQSKKIDGASLKKVMDGMDPVNYINLLSAPLAKENQANYSE